MTISNDKKSNEIYLQFQDEHKQWIDIPMTDYVIPIHNNPSVIHSMNKH